MGRWGAGGVPAWIMCRLGRYKGVMRRRQIRLRARILVVAALTIVGIPAEGGESDKVRPSAAPMVRVDVDSPKAERMLASAAGACANSLPASIRRWCEPKADYSNRHMVFTKNFSIERGAVTATRDPHVIEARLPTVHNGKGYLVSVQEPRIYCGSAICTYATNELFLLTSKEPVAVDRVASILVEFHVSGMWRNRQWWGPRVDSVTAFLRDNTGQVLSEATVLRPLPSK